MSIEKEIAKLECIKKTLTDNIPFATAVQTIHAEKCIRIFTEGKNSEGSLINHGRYNDNKPLYINPKKSPKGFKPQGKPFEFRNAKGKLNSTVSVKRNARFKEKTLQERLLGKSKTVDHTTRWFESYKEFRQFIGRRVDVVNLTLFGNLKLNFENRSRGLPSAFKVDNNTYTVGLDLENSLKKQGLEEKYGEIFRHTQEEIKHFHEIAASELRVSIKNCG